MKSLLKRIILGLSLVTAIIFSSSNKAYSSHAMGADITYECLGNGCYYFTVVIYRDCGGSTMGTTTNLSFNSPSCGQSFTANLQQIGLAQEVSQVCTPQLPNTSCGGGTLPGTEQWIYGDTVCFPAQCTDWNYSWSLCCRNGNITNLTSPTTYDLYVEGTMDNTLSSCNSSPQFSSLPTPYICAGQPYCYNHGTYDPDGDSLSFSLVQPLDAAGVPIPWAAGYSTTNPVLNTSGFNFDPSTGEMCFTPSVVQTCVISIEVEEWRNGVLIGTSIRELQIVVQNCTNQQPTDVGVGIQNLTGGPTANQTGVYAATVCPGDQICWDMVFSDPNGDNVTLDDNVALSIPGATFTAPTNGTGSVQNAQFCWTPTALDTGLHAFTVGVQDDGCPILGGNYYTFTIYVWDQTYAGPDQYYCPGGVAPQISAVGGNTFTWSVLSGDPINIGSNFSCNPCSSPVATPSQTTTYIVTSDLSAACGNQDTVTVFVVPDFPLTMSPNQTICLNEIVQISANATDPSQGPYTYNWTPTTGLDDPTVANPNASPTSTTTYTVEVVSASGCTIEDQVTVTVSGIGPTIYLTDTTICPGECVTLEPIAAIEPAVCGPAGACTGSSVTATVGGNTFSTSTYSPVYSGTVYEDFKQQTILTAAELQAAGVVPGMITEIGFNCITKNSTAPYQNFRMAVGCTNTNCLSTGTGWLPTTNVYGPANLTINAGWNMITLATPYFWDGTSNLVIETCQDFPNGQFSGGYDYFEYTSGLPCAQFMREYESIDGYAGCNLAPAFTYFARPNIRFTMCQIPPTSPTYTWTPSTNLSSTTVQNPVACPTASTTYQVDVTDGASGCTGSGTVTVTIDSTNYAQASNDVTICGGSTQLDVQFFGPQPPPAIPCGYGNACTQPTSTYTIGTGTSSSSTYAPFYSSSTYTDSRHQFLITAAELQAAGVTSGTFTTLAFNFITVGSINAYRNFRVGIACTNETCLSTATGWLPTTNVYGPVNFSPVVGWNTLNLTPTFSWDGVSNIVVETCFDNPNGVTAGGIDYVQYTSGMPCAYTMREYESLAGAAGCSLPPAFTYFARPNFQFNVCPPDPLALQYSWTPTGSLNDPTIQNPIASPTTTTQYIVTVTGGYCPAYDTVNVIISPLGPPTAVTTDVSCNGANDGTITVTAVGGTSPFTYSIDGGTTFTGSNTFTGLPPGTYDIVTEDAAGCQSTITTVTINEPPILTVGTTPVAETCDGFCDGSAIATVAGGTTGYTYNWTDALGTTVSTASSASGLCDGNYTLTVTDANGCTATSTFTINPGLIVTANFSYNGNQCFTGQSFNFTDLSTNATAWAWDFGASATPTTSTAQNPTGVTFSGPGTYPVTLTASNGPCEDVITINVVVYDEPIVTATGTNVLCNGACDGSVNATATGTSGYTYSWDNALGAGQSFSNLCPGTYTVTVTDINGCQDTDTYTVTEPTALTATATGTDLTCFGSNDGTATVTASGGTTGYTYSWSPAPGGGQNTATATGLSAQTYTVTVTDANGCTTTATFTPSEPAQIVPIVSSTDASCGQADGSVSVVSTTGGSGNYVSETWVDAGGNPVADPNAVTSGSYTVTVTDDNGCTGTATATVQDAAGPTISITAQTDALCNGACDGTATAAASGGAGGYTYSWSPAPGGGQGTTNATGLCAGSYSVTVTDANGCTASTTVTIAEPTAVSGVAVQDAPASCASVCNGQATVTPSGGTAGYTYLWDNAETTQTALALCAGTHTVDITDANGCVATVTVTISTAAGMTTSIVGTDALCNGSCDGSADLTVTGGTTPYTYAWLHGPTAQDLTGVLCAGTYTVDVTDNNGCTIQETVTINEPPALVIDAISAVDALCNGACDGELSSSASGGTGTLNYEWFDGTGTSVGTSANLTGICAGTYDLIVTDANNCTVTQSVTVNEPTALVLNTTSTNSNCGQADGSVTVTASGGTSASGYTYSWSNGTTTVGNTATVNNLVAGTYTVTVTDDNGCTQTGVATITDQGGGTATFTQSNVSCNGGSDGAIDVTITGGTAPYTYSWSNSATTLDLTGLPAGTYDLTATDAVGCVVTVSVTITEPTPLVLAPTSIDATCFAGADGEVSATTTGGTPGYTYEWFDNAALTSSIGTGSPLTGLAAGTYYVEVTDANGCTSDASITVNEPAQIVPTPTSVDANCGQSDGSISVSGTAGGSGVYVSEDWIDGSGNPVADPNAVPAGTYTVTVTDDQGCTGTATVSVNDLAGPTVAIDGQTDVTCNGACDGTADVTASGGTTPYTFTWTPAVGGGAGTANVTGLCAGSYTATVTDANGCSNAVTVTISEPTPLVNTITSSTDVTINGGSDGTADASASGGTSPYTYEWFNGCPASTTTGQTGTSATGLPSGDYAVIATDANGCVDTTCVTINEPNPIIVTVTSIDALCFGSCDGEASVTSTTGGVPGYTYEWYDANTNTTIGQTGVTASNLCAGDYYVIVTDANGGTTTSSTMTVNEPTDVTGVASVISNYSGEDISCNGACDGSIEVVATGGTPGYSYQWDNPANSTTATVNSVCAGTYNVTITDANGCIKTATVIVNEPTPLANNITSVDNSCFAACDGEATATPSGGVAPYTYQWDDPALSTTQTITGLCVGTYNVVITDANGCTFNDAVTITEPTELLISESTTGSNCGQADGSATVTVIQGDAPYTYQWGAAAGNQTTATATSLTQGCYDVTVTDANGCTSTITACVQDLGAPNLSILTVTDALCNGSCDGFVQVQVTGGTSPYTYQWYDGTGTAMAGETNASLNGACADTYTAEMTDANGCVASLSQVINEPTALNAITSSVDVTCFGFCDGQASVTASGGTAPYTYAWNDAASQTTQTATGLCPGTYNVTVTDDNGCTFDVTATVGEPLEIQLATTTVDAFCQTGSGEATVSITQGGITPFSYSWTPSGQSAATATGLTPGTYDVLVTDADGCQQTAQATVGNIPPGTATANVVSNASCNGVCDGTATVSMAGGTSSFTYEWFDATGNPIGQTTQTATGLCAGDYYVEVTDANTCLATSQTITITEPDILEVFTQVIVEPSCFGSCDGEVEGSAIGGTQPYNFQWDDPLLQANPAASNLCSGLYTVTVTDDNGCVETGQVTLTDPPALVLDSTVVNANCGQPDGQGCVTASGGTGPYTYLWPNGSTNSCEVGLLAGSYLVEATDANGCVEDIVVQVSDLNGPTADIIDSVMVSCNGGNDGSATVNMIGGAGTTFTAQWDANAGSQTTPTASNLGSGTYTVTITDDLGCNASASVVVTQPQAISFINSSSDPVCFGYCDGSTWITVSGGTTPYSYSWVDGANNPVGSNNDTITGLCADSYTLTLTDDNGCTEIINYVLNDPPQVTATSTSTDVTCNGACDGTATATGGVGVTPFTYQWDDPNGQSTQTASGLCPGTYTATVTDDDGCFTTTSVTITEPPILTSSITNSGMVSCASTCDGFAEVTPAGGTPPYTYDWGAGGTNQTATNLCAGTYTVTVTDGNGCTSQSTVVITQPNPLAATTTITNVSCYNACNGQAVVNTSGGTSPYTYQWDDPGFQTSSTATGLCAGTYTVVITDANGCQITKTVNITQPTVLSLSGTINSSNCGQANGSINVNVVGGVSPYTYQWNDPNTTTSANLSGVTAGCYTISILDANGCVFDSLMCINDIAAPTVTPINSGDVTCNGAQDGFVEFQVSGGAAPVTYELVDGAGTQVNTGQLLTNNLSGDCYTLVATDNAGCIGTDVICINEPNAMNSAITQSSDVSCNLGCDGTATVSISGGIQPYTISWNGGATPTQNANTGFCAGTYTANITDANGCPSSSQVTISEPLPITISVVNVDDASCNGFADGSIQISVSGGTAPYNYTWTPAVSTGPLATNLTAGTYDVLVTDANGCTENMAITVNEPQPLASTMSTINSTCTQCNGAASINVTGGTTPYSYLWQTGNTPQVPTNGGLCPGDTYVEVTDANGCAISDTATIIDEPSPVIDSMTVVTPTCNGLTNGSATVHASGGTGALSYLWDAAANGQTVQTAVGLGAGTYCVTVADLNNCTVSNCVTITEPNPLLPVPDIDATICYGDSSQVWASGQGGTTPYTITWQTAGMSGTGPISVDPPSSQQYCFTVTDANGCVSPQGCVDITVHPPLDVTLTPASTSICDGDSITLTATGSGGNPNNTYTFTWVDENGNAITGNTSGNTSTITVNPNTPTWYYVTLGDGCTISVIDSTQISINPLPTAAITAIDSAGCVPFTANLTAISDIGTQFAIDFDCDGTVDYTGSNPNASWTYDTPGTYDVCMTVTSADGCDTSIVVSQMITVYPMPTAGFSSSVDSTTILSPTIAFTNNSVGETFYDWDFGDGYSISGPAGPIPAGTNDGFTSGDFSNPEHTYQDTGWYEVTLTVTNDNGCTDTYTYSVYVEGDYILFAPSAFTPNGDGTNDVWKPEGIGISMENYRLRIFDRWGHQIFESTDPDIGWDGRDRTGSLVKVDVYIWVIQADDNRSEPHDYIGHVTVIR